VGVSGVSSQYRQSGSATNSTNNPTGLSHEEIAGIAIAVGVAAASMYGLYYFTKSGSKVKSSSPTTPIGLDRIDRAKDAAGRSSIQSAIQRQSNSRAERSKGAERATGPQKPKIVPGRPLFQLTAADLSKIEEIKRKHSTARARSDALDTYLFTRYYSLENSRAFYPLCEKICSQHFRDDDSGVRNKRAEKLRTLELLKLAPEARQQLERWSSEGNDAVFYARRNRLFILLEDRWRNKPNDLIFDRVTFLEERDRILDKYFDQAAHRRRVGRGGRSNRAEHEQLEQSRRAAIRARELAAAAEQEDERSREYQRQRAQRMADREEEEQYQQDVRAARQSLEWSDIQATAAIQRRTDLDIHQKRELLSTHYKNTRPNITLGEIQFHLDDALPTDGPMRDRGLRRLLHTEADTTGVRNPALDLPAGYSENPVSGEVEESLRGLRPELNPETQGHNAEDLLSADPPPVYGDPNTTLLETPPEPPPEYEPTPTEGPPMYTPAIER
jgi:hypothetical protein